MLWGDAGPGHLAAAPEHYPGTEERLRPPLDCNLQSSPVAPSPEGDEGLGRKMQHRRRGAAALRFSRASPVLKGAPERWGRLPRGQPAPRSSPPLPESSPSQTAPITPGLLSLPRPAPSLRPAAREVPVKGVRGGEHRSDLDRGENPHGRQRDTSAKLKGRKE